jgi:hypothetical protein
LLNFFIWTLVAGAFGVLLMAVDGWRCVGGLKLASGRRGMDEGSFEKFQNSLRSFNLAHPAKAN